MARRRPALARLALGLAVAAALLPPPSLAADPLLLKDNDRLAVCGDSITEQKLYSVYLQDYLLMCQPAASLRAVQVGWSGETSWGFLKRMEQDAMVFRPTVATTCYGMNDGNYAALTDEIATKYRQTMTDVVKSFKAGGARAVVVGSPGVVDPTFFPPEYIRKSRPEVGDWAAVYNRTLGQLRDIAREVAVEQGVAFADIHAPMLEATQQGKAKYGEKYHVAGADGVHPGPNGQLIMAYAFLKALGCDGNIGTITLDLAVGGKAEATAGHRVLSASGNSVEVESTRYPFCFFGDPSQPGSTASAIDFIPFNQELNRLMLVVRNAPAKRVRVTWGSSSKEFTREQLASGINLAAEFLDNPFCKPFSRVETLVREQQLFETAMIKTAFHLYPSTVGGREEGFASLKSNLIERDEQLARAASTAVKPVRHTIRVEPADD